jgi:hypothetical protein
VTIVREIFDPLFGRVTPFLRWVYMSVICCLFVAKRAGDNDNSLTCHNSLGAVMGSWKVSQIFDFAEYVRSKVVECIFH